MVGRPKVTRKIFKLRCTVKSDTDNIKLAYLVIESTALWKISQKRTLDKQNVSNVYKL
jgi:hypothetical protein